MTEAEWLSCEDPTPMLRWVDTPGPAGGRDRLGQRPGVRGLRLFTCACCRRAWDLLAAERSRQAAEAAERHADGRAGVRALSAARSAAEAAQYATWQAGGADTAWLASLLPLAATEPEAEDITAGHWNFSERMDRVVPRPAVAGLFRDIVGNPFRPSAVTPAWRTPDALSLAQAAYEDRLLPSGELDPARLAVLADALEDAGCTEPDLLSHLRSAGPHVRGCWALDLVLAKP